MATKRPSKKSGSLPSPSTVEGHDPRTGEPFASVEQYREYRDYLRSVASSWVRSKGKAVELVPPIAYELTDGRLGEPGQNRPLWRHAAWHVLVDAGRVLAEEFVADTGITPEAIAKEQPERGPDITDDPPPEKIARVIAWVGERMGSFAVEQLAPYTVAMLGVMARQQAERAAEDANRRAADAERRAEEAERRAHRTLIPSAIHGAYRAKDAAARHALVEQGMLLPEGDESRAVIAGAAVRQVNAREFADLSVPQIRALVGVCSRITEAGTVSGGKLFQKQPSFTARELYEAAGVNHRQAKQCGDLFTAMVDLSDRRTFFEITGEDPDTKKPLSAMWEGPVFTMVPIFPGEDSSLFDRYVAWRQKARNERGPWKGPLPARYTLTIPAIVRQTLSPLVISRDTLQRLEEGARKVRGNGKLTPLDWALFMEVTLTRQSQQLEVIQVEGGSDVYSFRSYVDRQKFLNDYLGEAEIKNNPARCERAYESSANVLRAGELMLDVRFARASRGGERDIYVPHPDVLLGIARRAKRVQELRAAEAEQKAQAIRRQAAKRVRRSVGKGQT